MRPKSIMLFERLYLLAIAIEMVRLAGQWPVLLRSPASEDRWIRVASIIVSLVLVLLTSRRRKRAAGAVLATLFVIGLPMAAELFRPGVASETVAAGVVQLLLQAAALLVLFRPESRAWFGGKSGGAAA